jgi:hypothetical protein
MDAGGDGQCAKHGQSASVDGHERRALAFAADVKHLAGISRPSASEGERQAAEWIAARLRGFGVNVRVDEERAHGGYWWPIGVLNGVAAAGTLAALRATGSRGTRRAGGARSRQRGRASEVAARVACGLLGAACAAALWDDLGGGTQWFRRAALPRRRTWNVVGEIGAPREQAQRTVLLIAHHDSAHTGLVFHPALPRLLPDRFPELHARTTQTFPVMQLTWAGPLLACAAALLGSRRLLAQAATFAIGTAAAMADIGMRGSVPGANDNLSAVAVLLAIAESLAGDPPRHGVRVILLSTGSEESFMEGMRGFAARHFGELDRDSTEVLCLECLGGPRLIVLEGEGMLRMRDYPRVAREALAAAAARAGVEVGRGLRTVAATDALIALRAGFRVAELASVDYTNFPANYHWPSDVPENLNWQTIGEAIAVTEKFARVGAHVPA